jgi:hypothetical protein
MVLGGKIRRKVRLSLENSCSSYLAKLLRLGACQVVFMGAIKTQAVAALAIAKGDRNVLNRPADQLLYQG